jgi:hypothetical protein
MEELEDVRSERTDDIEFKTPIPKAVGGSQAVANDTPAPNASEEIPKEVTKEKYCDGTPNVAKCLSIIKDTKQSIMLTNVSQWEQYSHKIKTIIAEQMWDETLIDISKTWVPNGEETLKQRKNRVELYKVIVGTLGKEHTGKLENAQCMHGKYV